MAILVVGLNHRSAPIEVLERVAISQERLPQALHGLIAHEHVAECVVLSTCNRVEAYAHVSSFHGGARDLRRFLGEFCQMAPEDLVDHLYTYHEAPAIRHLFHVAAGGDSMLLGEPEILGQVRRAFRRAQEEETAGRTLDPLFRRALVVGKRARAAMGNVRDQASKWAAAVELAGRNLPGNTLTGRSVAVVGAGDIACSIAQALRGHAVGDLVVVNRSEDRGRAVARRYGGRFRPMAQLESAIEAADVVIGATSAPQSIIDRGLLERAMSTRGSRVPLLVIDVGVPRNVAGDARGVPGVTLRGLSDVRAIVDARTRARVEDTAELERIVSQELDDYLERRQGTDLSPALSDLVAKANAIRELELKRLLARQNDLTPQQSLAVEQLSRRIVAKLLHSPLVRAKALSRSNDGFFSPDVLRELFELDGEASL